MNKQERKLKGRNKWIRIIKALGYWNKGNPQPFTYCFKEQGKPCSCSICKKERYNRNIKHKNKELEYE